MKRLSSPPAWHETPRTNVIVQELQSTIIPFDIAFWRLLELTRIFEVENNKLKKSKKAKKTHGSSKPKVPASRLAKKKVVAKRRQERPKAKMARKS